MNFAPQVVKEVTSYGSAWADGDTHTIEFWSYNDGSGITNFMIDDISIVCSNY